MVGWAVKEPINNRSKEHMSITQTARAASPGDEPEVFINKVEVARRLNCAVRSVDSFMSRGIVPFYKVSKRVLFKWSEVAGALERNCRVDRGGWKI